MTKHDMFFLICSKSFETNLTKASTYLGGGVVFTPIQRENFWNDPCCLIFLSDGLVQPTTGPGFEVFLFRVELCPGSRHLSANTAWPEVFTFVGVWDGLGRYHSLRTQVSSRKFVGLMVESNPIPRSQSVIGLHRGKSWFLGTYLDPGAVGILYQVCVILKALKPSQNIGVNQPA